VTRSLIAIICQEIQRYRFVIPAEAEALHNSEAGQSSVFHALQVAGSQLSLE
jgi:hypothetical protein